ncbi:RNA-binding S4 domain protein [Stanieria cyanosphaera PCC 7437]|uniref:RNA-binding S4 domain protein n=1 Tax=Stanieria cyanosphaera (strain ATCC 29371 / PCC 7437) TaxID=111780 RepID=K9XMF2_STAC7|nr:RNA-binding S4 domain-containing protein [Stanieria cyanosphaera]AFZ33780.1 RNA-binding S4 domain protein [Stanieria cyanosphaera PCC 7437]
MSQNLDNSSNRSFIKLDQFLKWQGLVQTGGEAKLRIKAGEILVNGEVETRRGRKLVSGDIVTVANLAYKVELN